MNTLEISWTEKQRAFISEQMARSGHASVEEYLVSLVKEAQKKRAWETAEKFVEEGMQTPAQPLTKEDWQALRDRIHQSASADDAK